MEAQYPSSSKRISAFVIVITLLIHLLMWFIFLLWKHQDALLEQTYIMFEQEKEKNVPTPQPEKMVDQKKEEPLEKPSNWVSGQAQGAQVQYQQEPEHISVAREESPSQDTTTAAMESVQPDTTETQTDTKEEELNDTQPQQTSTPITAPEQSTTLLEETNTQEHAQKTAAQDYVAPTTPIKKKKGRKPKLTLADLATGYMQRLSEASEHLVTSMGNNPGKATEDQLKYERYFRKLLICLNNSHKINREALTVQPGVQAVVHFTIVLNRDGRLVNAFINSSSGIRSIDDFALFISRDAGNSFPPIPAYIKENAFSFCYMVHAEQHNNGLRFYTS